MAGAVFNHQIWLIPTRSQQGHLCSYELCSYVGSRGLYWETLPCMLSSEHWSPTLPLHQITFDIHHMCQRNSKKWNRVVMVMAIFCQRCSERREEKGRGGGGRSWAIIIIHLCIALRKRVVRGSVSCTPQTATSEGSQPPWGMATFFYLLDSL